MSGRLNTVFENNFNFQKKNNGPILCLYKVTRCMSSPSLDWNFYVSVNLPWMEDPHRNILLQYLKRDLRDCKVSYYSLKVQHMNGGYWCIS